MNTSSVSSSGHAVSAQVQQPKPPAQQANAASTAPSASITSQSQHHKAHPTSNAQGQLLGQIVNTTA